MSNIWNPHAFGVTGQPVGPQVNTLRVYGAEPSKEQLAMAQQAFAKFCMTERLSFAPNQTQQGFLPDGSKYRIVVVGNTRIMEVRMDGMEYQGEHERGIGVIVGGKLYIVFYSEDKWNVINVKYFYGGSGVWVSSDYKEYLTDGNQRLLPPGFRKYSEDKPPLEIDEAWATRRVGVGYGGFGKSVGIITPAKKFASVSLDAYGTLTVKDVKVVPEAVIASTPDIPAATASTAIVVDIPGVLSDDTIRPYRTRAGAEVGFPVTGNGSTIQRKWYGEPNGRSWLSEDPLEGAVVVTCHSDGTYSAAVEPTSVPFHDNTDSGQDWLGRAWTARYEQIIGEDVSLKNIESTSSYVTPGRYGSPQCGFPTLTDSYFYFPDVAYASSETTATTKRSLKSGAKTAKLLVYLSKDWNDEVVQFVVDKDLEQEVTIDNVVITRDNRYLNLYGPSLPEHPPGWGGSFDALLCSSFGTLMPRRVDIRDEVATRKRKDRINTEITTPWGQIKQKDIDVTLTHLETLTSTFPIGAPYPISTSTDTWSCVGIYKKNDIIYVNPLIGVVAYISSTANKFTVTPEEPQACTVTVDEGKTELVVLARGKIVYQKTIGGKPDGGFFFRMPDIDIDVSDRISYTNSPIAKTFDVPVIQITPSVFACIFHEYDMDWEGRTTDYEAITVASLYNCMNSAEVRETEESPNFPLFEFTTPEDMPEYRVISAVDPNSGAGVLLIIKDGATEEAIALSPTGDDLELLSILPTSGIIEPQVLSV